MWYDPFLIPRSDVILNLGQKKPKFVYLILLVKMVITQTYWNIKVRKMSMRLILKFQKTCPQLWRHSRKIGSKRVWICALCTNSDRKIKVNNHTIFEESNSCLRSVFKHYKILMPPIPCFLVVTPLAPNLVTKDPNFDITYKWR